MEKTNNYKLIRSFYTILADALAIHIEEQSLSIMAMTFSFDNFNLFNIAGDLSELNVAHTSIGIEHIDNRHLIFPVVIQERHSFGCCILKRRVVESDFEGFECYSPWRGGDVMLTIEQCKSEFIPWLLLLESAKEDFSAHSFFQRSLDFIRTQKEWVFTAFMSLLVVLIFMTEECSVDILVLILSILGASVCLLIKHKKNGATISYLDNVCKKDRLNIDCDAVFESKYSNLLHGFSLEDAGLFYFCCNMMGYMLHLGGHEYSPILFLFNCVALLTSIFLVIIQKTKVKTFCTLCLLTTAATLFLNYVFFTLFNFNKQLNFLILDLISILVGFLVSGIIILLFDRGYLLRREILLRRKKDTDPDVFKALKMNSAFMSSTHNNRIFVNYSKGNEILDLHLSMSCSFCVDYLQEMINLLSIDQSYTLALFVYADHVSWHEKMDWINSIFLQMSPGNKVDLSFSISDDCFNIVDFDINSEKCSQSNEVDYLASNNNIVNYPCVFYQERVISPFYSPSLVKRHLSLQKYL